MKDFLVVNHLKIMSKQKKIDLVVNWTARYYSELLSDKSNCSTKILLKIIKMLSPTISLLLRD